MTEKDLAGHLAENDDAAWAEAHQLHHRDLYACAAHFLGSGPDAENAVQECWLAAHSRIAGFEWRGEGSLYAWLRQICIYKAFDQVRANHRQVIREGEELEALSAKAAAQQHRDASQAAERNALADLTRQCLAKLADPCARLLHLRELEHLSYSALAKAFQWPMGTVMSKLARCRRSLRNAVLTLLGEGA